jgi:hypothetical protein
MAQPADFSDSLHGSDTSHLQATGLFSKETSFAASYRLFPELETTRESFTMLGYEHASVAKMKSG